MTVRRDIAALESAGRVASVSGGITLPARLVLDDTHEVKARLHTGEKRAIARLAATMVPPGGLVYLDAGTTCLAIAEELAARVDLTYLTNDLAIATLLAERSTCDLYTTGGKTDLANISMEGEMAARAITRFNIGIAFMSTSAFDLRGTSVPSELKKVVKEAIVASATKTVLVTDSTKYGRIAALRAVGLEELDGIITDSGLPQAAHESLTSQGVALHIVAPSTDEGHAEPTEPKEETIS